MSPDDYGEGIPHEVIDWVERGGDPITAKAQLAVIIADETADGIVNRVRFDQTVAAYRQVRAQVAS